MWFRYVLSAVLGAVLALGAVFVFQIDLVGKGSRAVASDATAQKQPQSADAGAPARSSAAYAAPAPVRSGRSDPNRFNFVQTGNQIGDRIFLTTTAGITITPQASGPDKVTITPSGGQRTGIFVYTITPHQGSRGVRRAYAEFSEQDQTYRLCEVVDDPAGTDPVRAQRFAPVNNSGGRFTLPVTMDGSKFADLITAAVAGTAGAVPGGAAPSSQTEALAVALVGQCTGS